MDNLEFWQQTDRGALFTTGNSLPTQSTHSDMQWFDIKHFVANTQVDITRRCRRIKGIWNDFKESRGARRGDFWAWLVKL